MNYIKLIRLSLIYGFLLITFISFQNCSKWSNNGGSSYSASHVGKLLFKSNFGPGVTIKAPHDLYANRLGGWQGLTGTDSETGYNWSSPILDSYFNGVQLITVDPVTLTNIGDYITSEIRQAPGPKGDLVYELFTNVKIKAPVGEGGSQAPLLINRPWNKGDVTDLYISYWFKFQADLADRLDSSVSSGNWRVLFEFKTGGYNNTYAGDYRIQTTVLKGSDNKLYWMSKGDNVANGPWTRVDYWIDRNFNVPVPLNEWFKFEVFWHRSTGNDGRYWAVLNGQVITDHYGPNMGDLNLPINRIFIENPYSGGSPSIQSEITGIEIWSGFPCGEGVSCYGE